jgi:hypothetical protein
MAISAQRTVLAGLAALSVLLPACSSSQLKHSAAAPPAQDDTNEVARTFHERLDSDINLSLADHRQFYSPLGLGVLAAGIAGAAPLANGSADQDVHDWYQQRIKRQALDPLSDVFNYGGQAWFVVPLSLELMALNGRFGEDWQHDGGVLEWGNRSLRAIAIGYPPVVSLYGLLGASRPDRNDSAWHPFEDFHGVSGHTFIGAIPWLTAAAMTDNWLLKAPLAAGSFLTGWSRLHDDRHYFSQIALGWWIAALSVYSVGETQGESNWTIVPTMGPDGAGVALGLRY